MPRPVDERRPDPQISPKKARSQTRPPPVKFKYQQSSLKSQRLWQKTKAKMMRTDELPQPKVPSRRRGQIMDLSRALQIMGFGGWSDLAPDDDNTTEEVVKTKLDALLFQKTLAIETKRENIIKKKLRTDKMEEGQLKRRLKYEVDKEYDKLGHAGTPGDEERTLHEAYQFLMREFDARNKLHQIRLAAELTEAAQLTNFALSNGDSPDDSNSSTPILSRDPSFKRGSQKKRKRGSETRSVIRGKAEVFDLERPLNGMVPLSGPAQKDFDEPSSSTSNEAAMRAKLEQMML